MANESIRIPFNDSASRSVGTLAEKIREATKDVKQYEKALVDAAKSGKDVAKIVGGLNSARKRVDELKSKYEETKKIIQTTEQAQAQQNTTERRGERLVKRMQRVFGDQVFQKIAQGQKVEVADFIRLGLSSEKATIAGARLLGISPAQLTKLNPLLMAASESYNKLERTRDLNVDIDRNLELVTSKFMKEKLMRMTKEEFEYIGRGAGGEIANNFSVLFGNDPYKDAQGRLEKRAGLFGKLTAIEIDKTLESAEKRRKERLEAVTPFWMSPAGNLLESAKNKALESDTIRARMLGPLGGQVGEVFDKYFGSASGIKFKDYLNPKIKIRDLKGNELSGAQLKKLEEDAINDLQRKYGAALTPEMRDAARRGAYTKIGVTDETLTAMEKESAKIQEQKVLNQDASEKFHLKHQSDLYSSTWQTYLKRVPPNPTD